MKVSINFSDDNWKEIEELLCLCVEIGNSKLMEVVAIKIFDKRKLIDWKVG